MKLATCYHKRKMILEFLHHHRLRLCFRGSLFTQRKHWYIGISAVPISLNLVLLTLAIYMRLPRSFPTTTLVSRDAHFYSTRIVPKVGSRWSIYQIHLRSRFTILQASTWNRVFLFHMIKPLLPLVY